MTRQSRFTCGAALLLAALTPVFAAGQAEPEPRELALGGPNRPPVAVYRWAGVPFKPYVRELTTPSGTNVIRDAPADHLHHHGLMFAVTVDGVNFWEEAASSGVQRHPDPPRLVEVGTVLETLTAPVEWVYPADDKHLLNEERMLQSYQHGDLGANLLTWQSRLSLPEGKAEATLTGTAYHGLGLRFVEDMDDGGRWFNADGGTGIEGTNNATSAWTAYTAMAGGKWVTVALFSHPDNPRPARWFSMEDPFAYLSVTLNLDREPLVLTAEQPLLLRYGVAVWDGAVRPKRVEDLYKRWQEMLEGREAP